MMADVVIVDRVGSGRVTPYRIVGRTSCVACDHGVWLGTKTAELVLSGAVEPMCRECAARFIPKGKRPSGHVDDD